MFNMFKLKMAGEYPAIFLLSYHDFQFISNRDT